MSLSEEQIELLSAYLDEELSGEERAQAESLLAASEEARAWLDKAREEQDWIRAALPTAVSDGRALEGNRRRILSLLPASDAEVGGVEWLLAMLSPQRLVALGLPLAVAALVLLGPVPPVEPPGVASPGTAPTVSPVLTVASVSDPAPVAPSPETPETHEGHATFWAPPARAEVTSVDEGTFVVAMHLEEVDVDVIWIQN